MPINRCLPIKNYLQKFFNVKGINKIFADFLFYAQIYSVSLKIIIIDRTRNTSRNYFNEYNSQHRAMYSINAFKISFASDFL